MLEHGTTMHWWHCFTLGYLVIECSIQLVPNHMLIDALDLLQWLHLPNAFDLLVLLKPALDQVIWWLLWMMSVSCGLCLWLKVQLFVLYINVPLRVVLWSLPALVWTEDLMKLLQLRVQRQTWLTTCSLLRLRLLVSCLGNPIVGSLLTW